MSWVTSKAVLVSALNDLGYTEVPRGQGVEDLETFNHKCFTLESPSSEEIPQTGLRAVTYNAELQIVYVGTKNSDYDINRDLFNDLALVIADLDGFLGWEDQTFARSETKKQKQIGTFTFTFGIGGC